MKIFELNGRTLKNIWTKYGPIQHRFCVTAHVILITGGGKTFAVKFDAKGSWNKSDEIFMKMNSRVWTHFPRLCFVEIGEQCLEFRCPENKEGLKL